MAQDKYWDGTKWVPISASYEEFTTHKAEDAIHLATGTANAITILTGSDYTYGQFKQLRFKAVANNTGNVTINVDGKGIVPALKFDGTQLAAGAIKANKIYDWYYDTASGGRFFLIAKASGTAVVGDVLAGKPFSNDDGEQIGTMPNRGSVGTQNLTSQNAQYVIPAGYHNGLGKVQATYEAGRPMQMGTFNGASPVLTITGLPFTPIRVMFFNTNGYDWWGLAEKTTPSPNTWKMVWWNVSNGATVVKLSDPVSWTANGFTLPNVYVPNTIGTWIAFG
ncbi:hypothetical protein [Psychrobacillus sp. FSL H8-0487]|uniref:hypothetical protein n=1 Tax=Psychrobacillus sp. FSL H8-0487 TaxID=2921391 RepID=UPI0030FA0C83